MTDDLVQRLRDWVPAEGPPEGRTAPDAVADMRQASDRIEALTSALIKIREHNNTYGGSSYVLRIIEEALEKQP
jgi:hypothetical protein